MADPKELSLDQLVSGRLQVLQNARDLIRDAEVLLSQGRSSRAFFLSCIAIEESGKYLMIMSAILQSITGEVDWRGFWRRFKNHIEKTGNIVTFDAVLAGSLGESDLARILKRLNEEPLRRERSKLASLYVDYCDGGFSLPMTLFDEPSARAILSDAQAVLAFLESVEQEISSRADFHRPTPKIIAQIRGKYGIPPK